MLRRQAIRKQRKPLIVFLLKSLLRHKDAVSTMDEMSKGGFKLVIGEVEPIDVKKVNRVIFCTGKISRPHCGISEKNIDTIAIARLEQLYPFPQEAFAADGRYPKATEIV